MTGQGDRNDMTCEQFHALMPELIGSGEDISLHPHMQKCELCRALIADLVAIRDAARELFPTVEPPDDLWADIDAAIKAEKPEADPEDPETGAPDPEKSPA